MITKDIRITKDKIKDAEEDGRKDTYYHGEIKNYAKRIQDFSKKVKDKNYAW